ncbi:MAG: hypothetical protein H7257_12165 [Taibaiella sp.]|nr:hypothetical protein [Taibaiella sp.]
MQSFLSLLVSFNKGVRFVTPLNVFYFSAIIISIGNIIGQTNGLGDNNINSYMIPAHIPDATLIWCIGACSIFMGYMFFSEKNYFPSVRLDISAKSARTLFTYLLVLAIFSQSLNTFLSFLGSLTKLLYLLGAVGVMFYARLWGATSDRKYATYCLLLFVINTFSALTNSYLRAEILMPSVILFAGYFVGKGHIRALFSYRVLPFVLIFGAFIMAFSTLGKYRSNFGAVFAQELFTESKDESEDLYDTEEDKEGSFLERSAVIAQLSNVVKLTVDNGFYDGVVSAPVVAALIPRFLWPEKPLVQVGQWFAVEIGTAFYTDGHANNSINMTIPGQCYLDFGWLGVVIGCFLFGGFVSVMWNSIEFYSSPYNIIGILFGGYILLVSYGIGADLQLVVTYISTYLMLFAIKKLITLYFT